ncbi:MAG TPA: hypothetical protein DCR55_15240 [Lentisphaeria bacterium]|nr:hypothetical protein [Lentisphaeria bacterium]
MPWWPFAACPVMISGCVLLYDGVSEKQLLTLIEPIARLVLAIPAIVYGHGFGWFSTYPASAKKEDGDRHPSLHAWQLGLA